MEKYKLNNEGTLYVRDLCVEDVEGVYEMGKDEPYFCGFWDKDTLKAIPQSNDCYSLVARVDKNLAGFAIAQYSPTLRKATFENLYVANEFRKGIYGDTNVSRALSKGLVNKLRGVGAKSVSCVIEADNFSSKNCASKLGFESEGNFTWMRMAL